MGLHIGDGLIESITLFTAVPWIMRLDIYPFVVAYSICFVLILAEAGAYKYVGLIGMPLIFVTHLFLFLVSQWSVAVKSFIGYQKIDDNEKAAFLHIVASKHAGKDTLLKLDKNGNTQEKERAVTVLGTDFSLPNEVFQFQKITYLLDRKKQSFVRLDYPCIAPIKTFLEWRGSSSSSEVAESLSRWGRNEFDIPIPNFLDLYLDHLLAPFFLFQVLCLFLWSLDDYWYYSAFTLLMLMFFEGMMCKQRQTSLAMLRNMRRPPMMLFVYRSGRWTPLSSELLVPGDLISLSSSSSGFSKLSGEKQNVTVPCDALLIRGSCVVNEAMLTGESVPQMKESLCAADHKECDIVDLGPETMVHAAWKRHLVFGGTSLLLHSAAIPADQEQMRTNSATITPAPDGGCLAVVVRTGYATCQGSLMRKILFATEQVGGSLETVYFIAILVVFALFAAGSVLVAGFKDENRNKFRLVLHCIMIITSVVPPELPMELSLAVTNSLAALSKSLVYCTEPFRISFAGKLDVLCFDKTGTLTKDHMILRGIVSPQDLPVFSTNSGNRSADSLNASEGHAGDDDLLLDSVGGVADADVLVPECSASEIAALVMGACHDLILQPTALRSGSEGNNVLIGDPLEQATLGASGFQFDTFGSGSTGMTTLTNFSKALRVSVKHKYPFTSALKRMSVVVEAERLESVSSKVFVRSSSDSSSNFSTRSSFVLTKGAPEVLGDLLEKVPRNYRATYQHHMSKGKRVLALACRKLSGSQPNALMGNRGNSRGEVETALEFVGFLVFDCDLKADSKSVVRELRAASHRVVMITGDSPYTAADVAKKLGMLQISPGGKHDSCTLNLHLKVATQSEVVRRLVWRPLTADFSLGAMDSCESDIEFHVDSASKMANEFSLCVTGPVLSALESDSSFNYSLLLKQLCPHVTIFARVSPAQKERIVLALNEAGLFTLMCGDGTNDVGALKAAHVGISIVNNAEFESRVEALTSADATHGVVGVKKPKGASAKDRMARALKELQEQESDPALVKLGDASIASSFTARRTSIDSVLTVVRQGRCTLVTTIQVYKILALNCLVSAYMMSALYMRGLKQGDAQMTASGLIVAALFFFLSQAKPLQKISPMKPPSSVFAYAVGLSIVGQFVVHLASLLAVLQLCEQHVASEDFSLSPDGKFQPNVVNSAVFLLSALMQVNNFVVNYRGHPYTQSITENIILWRSIQVLYGVLLVVAGGQLEPLNDVLQMAPFPSSHFQAVLIAILLFNFCGAFLVEKACQKLE